MVKHIPRKCFRYTFTVYRKALLVMHECRPHGLINYLHTKEKYIHLKKFTNKETLRQVFIRVYRVEIQLVFRPNFVNCCPSNLLCGSTLPPPPSLCQSTVYIKTTWGGWERVLVLSPVGDHILQDFTALYPNKKPNVVHELN